MKRSTVLTAVVPDSGGVADSVGVFNAGRYLPRAAAGGTLPGAFHLQPSFSVALGGVGYFATEGDSYSIGAHDADGRLTRIIPARARTPSRDRSGRGDQRAGDS